MQVFLSYHSQDRAIAQQLKAAIEGAGNAVHVFMDVANLRRGHFWQPALYEAITEAQAFIILIGNKIGDWQRAEYFEAHDKKQKHPDSFTLLPIILTDRSKNEVPNLPGLAQLNWIETSEPTAPEPLTEIMSALRSEDVGLRTKPWQIFNPFRGLLALDEQDADFFFGRDSEIRNVLSAIAAHPGKIISLVGNSGVGKSSLVQAGVIPKLKLGSSGTSNAANSASGGDRRTWVYLTMKPGDQPVLALCTAFVDMWFESSTDPERIRQRNGWGKLVASGEATLGDLIDATCKRISDDLSLPPPQRIVLYIDQGEELYSQSSQDVTARFSSIIAEALSNPRLIVIMSLRADYYGRLQEDRDLFARSASVDVPPMERDALRAVLEGPAKLLGAKFESPEIVAHLVAQAWRQPAALPLLADLMTGLWKQMQERADGYIRPIGSVGGMRLDMLLTARAEAYLARNAKSLDTVRRLFTMKLVSLQAEGEPLRRRADKLECSDREWRIAEDLAGPDWRLLVMGLHDGRIFAEVGHEVLLREWAILRSWLSEEREFLAWKAEAEQQLHRFESVRESDRSSVLLDDWLLKQAKRYIGVHAENMGTRLLNFVRVSDFRPNLLKAGLFILAFHFMIKVTRSGSFDRRTIDYFDGFIIALVFAFAIGASVYVVKCLTIVRTSYSMLLGVVLMAFAATALLSKRVVEYLGVQSMLGSVRSWIYQLSPDPALTRESMILMAEWILLVLSLLPLLILYLRPRLDNSSPVWKRIAVAGGSACVMLMVGGVTLSVIDRYQQAIEASHVAAELKKERGEAEMAKSDIMKHRKPPPVGDGSISADSAYSPHRGQPYGQADLDNAISTGPDPAAFTAIFTTMAQAGKDAAGVAKLEALERTRTGVSVRWLSPDSDHSGYVIAGVPFKRGTHDCRNFHWSITTGPTLAESAGVSCRSIDGTWGDVASGTSFFGGDYGLGPRNAVNSDSNIAVTATDNSKEFNSKIGNVVYFSADGAIISPEAEHTLLAQVAWLKGHLQYNVAIEGHSDERGTQEYNVNLGSKRAAAVRDFLVQKGIDVSRITTDSFGKERPVAVCGDISCWSQNRRTKTVLQERQQGENVPREW